MKRTSIAAAAFFTVVAAHAQPHAGMVTHPSPHPVAETMDRVEAAVRAAITPLNGLRVFARIDFRQLSGDKVRPNQAILFGSGGALAGLADRHATVTMDLPVKILVWEDESGKTWLSYNSAAYLRQRHGVTGSGEQLERIERAAKNYIEKALQ